MSHTLNFAEGITTGLGGYASFGQCKQDFQNSGNTEAKQLRVIQGGKMATAAGFAASLLTGSWVLSCASAAFAGVVGYGNSLKNPEVSKTPLNKEILAFGNHIKDHAKMGFLTLPVSLVKGAVSFIPHPNTNLTMNPGKGMKALANTLLASAIYAVAVGALFNTFVPSFFIGTGFLGWMAMTATAVAAFDFFANQDVPQQSAQEKAQSELDALV